jgi:hypothetical protein
LNFKWWALIALALLSGAIFFDGQSNPKKTDFGKDRTVESKVQVDSVNTPVQVKDLFTVFPPPVFERTRKFDAKNYASFSTQTWAAASVFPLKVIVPQQRSISQSSVTSEATVPAIPFKFMGAMDQPSGPQAIYLMRNDELLNVSVGSVVDGQWRIEKLTEAELQLTYLPAGIKVNLNRD